VPLPLVDLSGLPAEAREAEALRLASAEAARPFDLAAGPVLRMKAAALAAEEHVVLFTVHHIASDGWSTGVLVREVSAAYAAYAAGEEPALAELPVQYADYAVWQREHLEGEVLERQVSYWRERLAARRRCWSCRPTGRAPPLVERGATHGFAAPGGAVRAAAGAGSRSAGATLYMVLLAGWQALLGRYAGRRTWWSAARWRGATGWRWRG
jgi:hypothetical protein